MKIKEGLFSILLLILLLSCSSTPDNSFLNSLVEKQIGESNLYLSLPPGYDFELSEGIFTVYYFKAIDTTIKAEFSGGFFIGNHPNEFEPDNDSCKTTYIKDYLFNTITKWKVYLCNEEFAVQSIVYFDYGSGMHNRIHSFGAGKSAEDLDKLMTIFSTLKVK